MDEGILGSFYQIFTDLNKVEDLYLSKPLLAHYTTIPVLEKIVKEEEVWFSNPLFMNDLEEVRFGIHEGIAIFDKLTGLEKACGTAYRTSLLKMHFYQLYEQFEQSHVLDTYVFCLSEHDKDNNDGILSMWRGYGAQGHGAAIVFNTNSLEMYDGSPLIIAKVRYGSDDERKEILKKNIDAWCSLVRDLSLPDDKLWIAAYALLQVLKAIALTSKHVGFNEEKEWRVIYMGDRDSQGVLNDCLGYHIGPRGVEPKLKFKISPSKVAPGQTWTFNSIIERIILGPTVSSPLAKASIIRMLTSLRKPELTEKVVASRIPLRSTQ